MTFPLHSVGSHSKSASASDRNDSEKGTEHDDVNSFPFLVSLSILSVRGANVSKTNCRSLCPISAGEFEQEREREGEKKGCRIVGIWDEPRREERGSGVKDGVNFDVN